MSHFDLAHIEKVMDKFVSDRDWDQFHTLKNLSMALNVEASELLEIFQWLTPKEAADVKNNPTLKEKVSDEVADIFFYLLRVTQKADIDLQEAVLAKIQKSAKKYPVEKSRGSIKKYTEL